jgi:O-antigen ligase
MNKALYQIIDKGIVFFCLLTLLLFPYGLIAHYPFGVMMALLIVSLFFKAFRRSEQSKDETIYLGVQMAFWFIILLSYFWSRNKTVSSFDLEIKLSLLVVPLVFYFGGIPLIKRKPQILLWFFVSMVIFSVYKIGIVFYSLHNSPYTMQWFWDNYEQYTYSCLPNLQHHTYISLYLAFAVFIGLDTVFNSKTHAIKYYNRIIIITGILSLLLYMFLINSRAGIIALLITLPIYVILKIPNPFKVLAITCCAIFVLTSGCYFLNSNPRVKQITAEIKNNPKEIVNPQKSDPRIGIWTVSWECVKEHFWTGVGNGDARDAMRGKYTQMALKDSYYDDLKNKKLFNSHNQYLETWLTTGILGFILLITTLLLPLFQNRRSKYYEILIAFVALSSFNFIFESMYDTFIGVGFITFICSFLYYGNSKLKVSYKCIEAFNSLKKA